MPLPSGTGPSDFGFDSKEPWAADTYMMIPFERTQILVPETAALVGVQAFLKIARLPFTTRELHNAADISPNGKLPVVKCGAYVVSELEGVVGLAASKGISLSDYLNQAEKADLRAYMSLVHNVLGNALLHLTWLDDGMYGLETRVRVGSPYAFPLKYLLPWTLRRKVKASLNALKWGHRTAPEVYKEVETCLLALSERLGESEYFFGASPTELDALVFGYLFTLITAPLPAPLASLVKHHPNLTKFTSRIERDYFTEDN